MIFVWVGHTCVNICVWGFEYAVYSMKHTIGFVFILLLLLLLLLLIYHQFLVDSRVVSLWRPMNSPHKGPVMPTLMFLWCGSTQAVKQTVEWRVIWDYMAIGSGNIMLLDGTKQCWLLAGDVLWYLPQSPGENNFTADGQMIIPIQWVWKLSSPWANALINIKILEKTFVIEWDFGPLPTQPSIIDLL